MHIRIAILLSPSSRLKVAVQSLPQHRDHAMIIYSAPVTAPYALEVHVPQYVMPLDIHNLHSLGNHRRPSATSAYTERSSSAQLIQCLDIPMCYQK